MKKFILIVFTAFVLAFGVVYFFANSGGDSSHDAADGMLPLSFDPSAVPGEASSTLPDVAPISESTPPTQQVTEDQRRYQNAEFHFGLLYPKELSVKEYKEQGGALTVNFQDAATKDGFEVYAVRYDGKKIDTARFKQDEPSGVYQQPTDIIVDGMRGTMFFGKNGYMGDTREVWMVRGGILYEVMTYKDLDAWLAGIMRTWKFI